jgi:predicted nucleotidyltransferase
MIAALPQGIRDKLLAWTKSLEAVLADDLVGVIVHGSVARGDYRPGESDVDVVVVVKEATYAQLEAISAATQKARYEARLEPTILTEDEIAGAADVFPLLYDEIKRCHVVVVGRDPFAPIVVHDRHRRLRIEQELRQAAVTLRRAVLDACGAPEAVGGAVARKSRHVRGPLHALLTLKGFATAADLPSVLARLSEVYGVDVAALAAPREHPEAAHAALDKLLRVAIEDVNAFEVKSIDPRRAQP